MPASYFKWVMGDYVGGQKAVHQAYKPWMALDPEEWATGEVLIQPRDTADLVFTTGFEPDVVFLISYRPRNAGGKNDAAFGARGGGMTYGAGGRACPGGLAQFTGSTRIRHAFEQRYSFWREDAILSVVHKHALGDTTADPGEEILRLVLDSLDPTGFTLQQVINLYDQTDYVAWLAMKGRFHVGTMSTGDSQLYGVPGTATGAVFLSTKHTPAQIGGCRINRWDHSQGFATAIGNQAAIWGGMRDANWDRTTERWADSHSILICDAQLGTAFVGAKVLTEGRIWNWFGDSHTVTITRSGSTATVTDTGHGWATGQCIEVAGADQGPYNGVHVITVTDANTYEYTVTGSPATPATGTITATVGGVDISYDTLDSSGDGGSGAGSAFRVGYVLTAEECDSGVLETNWETRPGGTENDPPGSGVNRVDTLVRPRVVLMQATNYNFDTSDVDAFDWPRLPDQFWSGGSGGLGWHVYDFDDPGTAYGVHTYGNGIAELGRYANSGTQYMRNYILAGQGANSNPPAYHQHSVNIIPSPKIVGLNYRYGERHAHVKRFHTNVSDLYVP